jgi:hypothetical protein
LAAAAAAHDEDHLSMSSDDNEREDRIESAAAVAALALASASSVSPMSTMNTLGLAVKGHGRDICKRVGRASALVTFISVHCTLRTQISWINMKLHTLRQ